MSSNSIVDVVREWGIQNSYIENTVIILKYLGEKPGIYLKQSDLIKELQSHFPNYLFNQDNVKKILKNLERNNITSNPNRRWIGRKAMITITEKGLAFHIEYIKGKQFEEIISKIRNELDRDYSPSLKNKETKLIPIQKQKIKPDNPELIGDFFNTLFCPMDSNIKNLLFEYEGNNRKKCPSCNEFLIPIYKCINCGLQYEKTRNKSICIIAFYDKYNKKHLLLHLNSENIKIIDRVFIEKLMILFRLKIELSLNDFWYKLFVYKIKKMLKDTFFYGLNETDLVILLKTAKVRVQWIPDIIEIYRNDILHAKKPETNANGFKDILEIKIPIGLKNCILCDSPLNSEKFCHQCHISFIEKN